MKNCYYNLSKTKTYDSVAYGYETICLTYTTLLYNVQFCKQLRIILGCKKNNTERIFCVMTGTILSVLQPPLCVVTRLSYPTILLFSSSVGSLSLSLSFSLSLSLFLSGCPGKITKRHAMTSELSKQIALKAYWAVYLHTTITTYSM